MTPKRWRRIVELFEEALARPEGERAPWLEERAAGDPELHAEVERLLAADHGAGSFLAGPAGAPGPEPRGRAAGAAPARAAFGRYEVVERIGGGGFSEVFRGVDPTLRRPVAIKSCRWASAEVRRRFAREAEIVAGLDHPNITTVYDFGVDGDAVFLVQELLAGEDLHRLLERRPLPPPAERVAILLQIARGLAHAHAQGVIHRDVKPSNLRIEPGGRVKIMDFGIAALLGDATRLTQAGTVLGTAAYMAPEQIRGRRIGPASDVYSFGAVAYELCAGRPPYRAESLPGLLYQLLHADPEPLAAAAPDCPPALAALVDRCLAREAEDRPPGFEEVIAALEGLAAGGAAALGEAWREAPAGGEDDGAAEGREPPPGGGAPRRAGSEEPEDGTQRLAASERSGAAPSGERRRTWADPSHGGREPALTSAPARPGRDLDGDRGAVRSRRRRLAALAAAVVAAAALGTWLVVATGSRDPDAPPAPVPGLLAIDAGPWAEVAAVRDGDGGRVALPAGAVTPLALSVPPGEYTVVLRHPGSPAPRECTATVGAGAAARCRAEFAHIDARDFVAREAPP